MRRSSFDAYLSDGLLPPSKTKDIDDNESGFNSGESRWSKYIPPKEPVLLCLSGGDFVEKVQAELPRAEFPVATEAVPWSCCGQNSQ